MSALTEKLGLTIYDDTDNPTVKSWRDTINKNTVQSAFSIIDAYAIATDARIATVEQSRKLFRISATEEVANIYLATAPEIESLSNGVQIQVSFDATNTGAATININSTGAKALQKISLSGVAVNIEPNDIIANKIYTFEYYDNAFIKVGGFSSSEIIMTEGSQDNLLQIGSGGKIQESPVALYNGKISGDGINIGNMLTVENNNIELPTFAETIPGTYLGLTVDAYGRITSTDTPVPSSSGAFVLNSVDGALSWSTKAPDSDKLDGVDSTGYVNTTGAQTIGGTKTFSILPTLPTTTPTTNQPVRKGYADTTYLGISAKALDSDKLDGYNSTDFFLKATHVTKNAVQAIPHNTITKVIWQVATRDDLSMWSSAANTRLTVKQAGYYDIFFYCQLEGGTSGTWSWACLYVNNLIVHYNPPVERNQYGNQLVLNFRGQYAVNDYLEIGVDHDFGSNKNIVVSILPVFSAVRLG